MSDGQAVGAVLVAAMVALTIYAAIQYRRAPIWDGDNEQSPGLWLESPIFAETVAAMGDDAAAAAEYARQVDEETA